MKAIPVRWLESAWRTKEDPIAILDWFLSGPKGRPGSQL